MAGPLDLRGRVTITNGGSGTLHAIKGDLSAIGAMSGRTAAKTQIVGNALATGAANAKRFAGNVGLATVGTYGLISAVAKAEEYNRAIFGVGNAALSDNTRRDAAGKVVYDFEKVGAAMKDVENVTMSLTNELGQAPSRLSGIAEVLAKAGFDTEKLAAGTKAVALAAVTDMETPVAALGEFASVLDTIYKPKAGEKWGEFFARQLDIVRVAAGETRLSVGSMMEGLRPFSALYSILGNDEVSNAALLMAGVRKGGEATEIGHTLKMDAVRFLNMTAQQARVFNDLGLRRKDYSDTANIDPIKAVANLARTFRSAEIKGGYRAELETAFEKAQRGGYMDDPEFLGKIRDQIARRGKIDTSNENSRDAFEEQFTNSVFGSGMRVNMPKLFLDMIAKGATPGQWATMYDQRRIGSNMQIKEGLQDFYKEFIDKLSMADGSGLGATQTIFDQSNFGALMRWQAMWEKFQIGLANSGGLQTFLSGITKAFEVLGSLPKGVTDIAAAAGVLAVALAPLSFAFRGLAGMARVLKAALAFAGIGRAAGAAGAGMAGLFATGATAAGVTKAGQMVAKGMSAAGAAATTKAVGDAMIKGMSAGALASTGASAAGKLGWLGKLGGRLVPGLGAGLMIGGAGWSAYDSWQRGEGWGDMAKHAAWGAIGLDSAPANAAEGPGAAPMDAAASDGASGVQASSQEAVAAAQTAANEIRQAFASIDLAAEGQRMMASLASGIRAGGAQAVAAANDVAAQVRAAGSRVQLNTGPAMQPAR